MLEKIRQFKYLPELARLSTMIYRRVFRCISVQKSGRRIEICASDRDMFKNGLP